MPVGSVADRGEQRRGVDVEVGERVLVPIAGVEDGHALSVAPVLEEMQARGEMPDW
jgi:hypothetical protein